MPHRKTLEELRREKEALRGPPLSARSLQSLRNLKASLPAPRPRVQEPLSGGLESVAGNGLGLPGSPERVARARAELGSARGVPRSRPDETQEQLAERLRRGGRTEDAAGTLAARRFEINARQTQVQADRQQRRSERDTRLRATGLRTPDERREETTRRILERKGIFREDVNRRRQALGLKPLGPIVQGRDDRGPVEVTNLDEVTERNGFGSGSFVRDPDGQLWRYNRVNGIDSYTPMVVDLETGLTVTDMDQIEFDEFIEALDESERRAWREIIRRHSESTGDRTSQRKIIDVNNERTGVSRIPGGRKKDEEQRADGREQLDDKEARVFFDYAKDVGLNLTQIRQEQSDAEIKQQVEEEKRDDKQRIQLQKIIGEARDDVVVRNTDINKRFKLTPKQFQEKVEEEVRQRLELGRLFSGDGGEQQSSTGDAQVPVYIDGSDESFNRLAPGTVFIGPDGKRRIK